jgi:hypothetical protein
VATIKGNPRKTDLEQAYTPIRAAETLTAFMLEVVGADHDSLWIEPAAGTGVFLEAFKRRGIDRVIALDIDPKHPGVDRADFLDRGTDVGGARVCLTNPPFGRNNSLSVPFFNKLAQSCDLIAVIVPRSWRKWSVVNRLDPAFVKIVDYDLDLTYTDAAGVPLTDSRLLNTIFQVWARADGGREKLPVDLPPRHFELASPEEANVALTLFGRGCGTVRREFPRRANSTQMFIRADEHIAVALESIDLSPFFTQVAYIEALGRTDRLRATRTPCRGVPCGRPARRRQSGRSSALPHPTPATLRYVRLLPRDDALRGRYARGRWHHEPSLLGVRTRRAVRPRSNRPA